MFGSDARFAALRPANTDLIGECCSYEAFDSPTGYEITISIGWGDCEAGCISHHRWQYHVDPDGTIGLVSEQGEAGPPPPVGGPGPASVVLHTRAGPTCPVQQVPPQPGCEPRAVVNASVVLRDPSGAELATAMSDDGGRIVLRLPAGAYYVEPQTVEGLLGTAPAVAFSVVGGDAVDINLDYDTGIR